MPYVVKYGTKYLRRATNVGYSRRKRELVASIADATTWSEIGHAKNAAREAYVAGVVPSAAVVAIVAVRFVEGDRVTHVKRKRDATATRA